MIVISEDISFTRLMIGNKKRKRLTFNLLHTQSLELEKEIMKELFWAFYFALHFAGAFLGLVIAINLSTWLGLSMFVFFLVKFMLMLPEINRI